MKKITLQNVSSIGTLSPFYRSRFLKHEWMNDRCYRNFTCNKVLVFMKYCNPVRGKVSSFADPECWLATRRVRVTQQRDSFMFVLDLRIRIRSSTPLSTVLLWSFLQFPRRQPFSLTLSLVAQSSTLPARFTLLAPCRRLRYIKIAHRYPFSWGFSWRYDFFSLAYELSECDLVNFQDIVSRFRVIEQS